MGAIEWKSLRLIVRAAGRAESEKPIGAQERELIGDVLEGMLPARGNREVLSIPEGLAWIWRTRFLPLALDPRFKREWNLFFALEVGYFYPLRKGKHFPGNPGQIGVLLADQDHLALVAADGDHRAAQALLDARFGPFWRAIIPQECAVPYSTVQSRICRGLELLAKALNGWRPTRWPVSVTDLQVPGEKIAPLAFRESCLAISYNPYEEWGIGPPAPGVADVGR